MPPEISRLTKQFLNDPVRIEVSRPATTADNITQHLVRSPAREPHDKRDRSAPPDAHRDDVKNGIVFCNRKSEVDIVAKSLKRHGFDAAPIHGDLDQSARTAALDRFRNGELTLLVASDVAARGLDIPDVSHVFNYDVPHHADDYVHRIGRTGRAGRPGTAITIVAPSDGKSIAAIEKLIGQPIAWMNGTPAPAADAPAPADDEPRRRQPRSAGHQRPARPAPPRRESGSVARLDEARQVKKAAAPAKPVVRPSREPSVADDDSGSHLPAFLLRPFRAKA